MKLEKEGINLEYKTAKNMLPNDFWKTYSAFANTSGGTVILGVEEREKFQYEIVGVNDADKIIGTLWDLLSNKNKVNINLLSDKDINVVEKEGKTIIIIHIPEAYEENKPVYLNDRMDQAYKRTNDGDRLATKEQLKYMLVNSQDDIDNEVLKEFDLDDINIRDVHAYRDILVEKTGDKNYLNKSDEEFLKSIGAMKKDRKDTEKPYKLTTGGLLFFGKYNSIRDRFPKFQLDYFKKASSLDTDWIDRVSTGDMSFPELNIFSFTNIVMVKLISGVQEKFQLKSDLSRSSFQKDLSIALREALINSLMHAYYDSDEPIKISEYSDYYEYFNPGKMKISREEFIHGGSSKIRNSTIGVLFRRIGYSEKAGSGGPRIFDAAQKNNLKVPDIITTDETTTIRIWKTDIAGSLKEYDGDEKKIIEFLIENRFITKSTALENLDINEYRFLQAIKILSDNEVIEKVGKGRATKYMLNKSSELGIYNNKKMLRMLEDLLSKK